MDIMDKIIHGDLSQFQRDHVMNRFRKRNLQILVATDVAFRGIDINELTHVINYNLPDDNEVYVHRSGRTGRAGNKGVSIIIAHSREKRKLQSIEKMIKKELTLKKVPGGQEICEVQLMSLIDKIVETDVSPHIEQYLNVIEEKLSHLNKEELLKHFVSAEFNRFLSFYKNAQDLNINTTKDKSNERRAENGFTRFFINLGKTHKLEPQNLIGLINEYTRNRNHIIGKIDIMKNFSFFEVEKNLLKKEILEGFLDSQWNGYQLTVEISKPKMTLVKEEKKIQVLKEEEKNLVETKEKNLLKDHQELTENLLKVDLKTVKLLEKEEDVKHFFYLQ